MARRFALAGNTLHVVDVEGEQRLSDERCNLDDAASVRALHLGEETEDMERCQNCFPIVFADGDTGNETESD